MKNSHFYASLLMFILCLIANILHMNANIDHFTPKYQNDGDILSIFLVISLVLLCITAITTKKSNN